LTSAICGNSTNSTERTSINSAGLTSDVNGVALTTAGAATNYLDETGNYSVPDSGGQVNTVVGGTNITVDAADPVNPIVNLDAAINLTSVVATGAGGSAASALRSVSTQPAFELRKSDATLDNKSWDSIVISQQLRHRLVNDADTVAANYMTVDRTGTTADLITFPGTAVDVLGAFTAATVNGIALTTGGVSTNFLDETGNYSAPAGGGGGQVNTVVGGTNITVDATDPVNPIVNLDAAITSTSVNAVTLSAGGAATNFLDETGNYSVPAGGSATPGGADTEVQFNNAGAFGGISGITTNGTSQLNFADATFIRLGSL